MTGETIEKVKQIVNDLKSSWYFRIWSVLWIVVILVTFSCLVIIIKKDRRVNETWIEFSRQMPFPNFHFRVDRASSQTFYSMDCEFDGTPLQWQQCADPQDSNTDSCRAIHPISPAVANHRDRLTRSINCNFLTNGTGPEGDIMAFELEGEHIFSQTDGAGDTATWFAPNSMTWLIMKKKLFQFNKDTEIQIWDTTPIYHSTIFHANNFNVTVMIGQFIVEHIQPYEMYSGWLVFGAIGGVGFFMAIIQTAVMIIFGLVLSNNSTFLKGGGDASGNPSYSPLK